MWGKGVGEASQKVAGKAEIAPLRCVTEELPRWKKGRDQDPEVEIGSACLRKCKEAVIARREQGRDNGRGHQRVMGEGCCRLPGTFPNNMHVNPGILSTCRFWFRKFGLEPEVRNFTSSQVTGHTWSE